MIFSLSHNNNGNYLIIQVIPVLFLLIFYEMNSNQKIQNDQLYAYSFSTQTDTSVHKTEEVKIISTKIKSNSLIEMSPVTTLSKDDIEKLSSNSVSEVINFAPGIFIKDYGGLGGLKTISVRGSSSNQTLILLNGVRLNSNQNGMIDLSNIPISMIDNIEIVRSGLSSVYGGNSMSGVVNLNFNNFISNEFKAKYSIADFGERLVSFSSANQFDNYRIKGIFEYKKTDGTYDFKVNHFGTTKKVKRNNNELSNYAAAINTSYINDDIILQFFGLFTKSERGVPGAVLQGHIESENAAMKENSLLLSLTSEYKLSEYLILKSGINTKINFMNFKDENLTGIGGESLDNDFHSKDYNIITGFEYKIDDLFINLNFESIISQLDGELIQPDIVENPQRNNLGVSANGDYHTTISDFISLNLVAALRYDIFSDNIPAISPFCGLIITPYNSEIQLKLNFSKNFRMPSFNELYYLNYGTANLKPEEATTLNMGLSYFLYDFYININAFTTNTSNLILAVPKSPVIWSAQNIGESLSKGIEISLNYKPENSGFIFNLNYTLQKNTDNSSESFNYGNQLPYTPQELINFNLSYKLYDIILISKFNYSSFRYSLINNDISSVLPDYFTLGFGLIEEFMLFETNLQLNLSVDNITNEQFAVVRNFPMPGRMYRAGISLKMDY